MPATILLPIQSPAAIPTALEILRQDGLVAFPTDTVYGLAASFTSPLAIERLFTAKGREFNKAIAILIGEMDQIPLVSETFPERAALLAHKFWPGALTLVVSRLPGLPANLSPDATIGLRMPDHAFARRLLQAAGPLATTSANISGMANPLSAADVLQQLDGRIDLLLDGGSLSGGIPSTVVGCTTPDLTIFRQGAIPSTQIMETLSQP